MISMLKNWKGPIEINGVKYKNIQDATSEFERLSTNMCVLLYSHTNTDRQSVQERPGTTSVNDDTVYKIKVKQYMTRKASIVFDFMAKWNHDVPMPLRVMVGTKVRETNKMVYMKLHGDIVATKVMTCMKCGKPITNPISQFFGMGPECGGHNYINPFNDEAELKEAVESYRQKMQKVTWEGWIIKSAIEEETVYG